MTSASALTEGFEKKKRLKKLQVFRNGKPAALARETHRKRSSS